MQVKKLHAAFRDPMDPKKKRKITADITGFLKKRNIEITNKPIDTNEKQEQHTDKH